MKKRKSARQRIENGAKIKVVYVETTLKIRYLTEVYDYGDGLSLEDMVQGSAPHPLGATVLDRPKVKIIKVIETRKDTY